MNERIAETMIFKILRKSVPAWSESFVQGKLSTSVRTVTQLTEYYEKLEDAEELKQAKHEKRNKNQGDKNKNNTNNTYNRGRNENYKINGSNHGNTSNSGNGNNHRRNNNDRNGNQIIKTAIPVVPIATMVTEIKTITMVIMVMEGITIDIIPTTMSVANEMRKTISTKTTIVRRIAITVTARQQTMNCRNQSVPKKTTVQKSLVDSGSNKTHADIKKIPKWLIEQALPANDAPFAGWGSEFTTEKIVALPFVLTQIAPNQKITLVRSDYIR
jgi:hypothetical protein